jgi:hypothetical protein
MISKADFGEIVQRLGAQGQEDIAWSESLKPPASAEDFAIEAIFVICNSGIHHKVARGIFNRVCRSLMDGKSAREGFGHRGKSAAIDYIWKNREGLFDSYRSEPEAGRLEFLHALPWIGDVTKYHLAKNFGLDVAKPDVHLSRLAAHEGCSPQELCQRLAIEVGLRVATVDVILWRACAIGILKSTGELAQPRFEFPPEPKQETAEMSFE